MVVSNLILVFLLLLFITIVYTDFSKRVVYNFQVLLAFFLSLISSYILDFKLNIASSIVVFLIGFLLWKFGLVGAADVKLLSVLILSIPEDGIFLFFMLMSIVGFLIALFVLFMGSKRGVPYAPAIALSHILVFLTI